MICESGSEMREVKGTVFLAILVYARAGLWRLSTTGNLAGEEVG